MISLCKLDLLADGHTADISLNGTNPIKNVNKLTSACVVACVKKVFFNT